MNLFERLLDLVRPRGSHSFDTVAPAPLEVDDHATLIADVAAQLDNCERGLASALADEHRLRDDIEAHLNEARQWMQRAERASERGEYLVAEEALSCQEQHQVEARNLEKTRISQLANMNRLKWQADQARAWLAHLKQHSFSGAAHESDDHTDMDHARTSETLH